ncbi:response regulator [Lacipirellula limnantheis]|uniref:Response regulator protein VraR n=1 Tax=Lacipirellula limnantheis TaxID=2528024 RepID=A0A517U0R5_9BACT|nr:response regulator transcription factor [Lacipirellula limnantheis]QDT74227.1 Response regulator protein VraR [Lacipirellula limnantheis]
MTVRLLIADDHEVIRAGLRSLLADIRDVEIIGDAADGEEAIRLARRYRPDVILLDVRMPGVDGLGVLSQLRAELPGGSIVMFSSYDNPTYIARAVALGAAGYLVKNASRDEIVAAIRRAAAGDMLWSREGLRRVAGALSTPRAAIDFDAPLTRRESEVLRQLALGLSNKEIAQALDISYETVKEHVQHILRKLGVADRTQAAVWAVRKGIA